MIYVPTSREKDYFFTLMKKGPTEEESQENKEIAMEAPKKFGKMAGVKPDVDRNRIEIQVD